MGVKQSKRSVDITTTPSKQPDVDSGRVEKIKEQGEDGEYVGDVVTKATALNGTSTPMAKADIAADEDSPAVLNGGGGGGGGEGGEAMNGGEGPEGEEGAAAAALNGEGEGGGAAVAAAKGEEGSKPKKEKKMKKKWSLRSISFSRREKVKPRDDSPKNGEVAKEEEESPAAEPYVFIEPD
ncbi:A-kinase anchor protein 200-like [Hetaerina americana]|uniref:A-kinase anchor protein 200-like n=1 Tax=Hetaerina americana TaxID=62018 RepID=UPI003A7F23EA